MSPGRPAAPLVGAAALVERAIGYTRLQLEMVVPERLGNPTPCAAWDLGALLAHMEESLAALQQAADTGHVHLVPPVGDGAGLPLGRPLPVVARLRARACALLGSWSTEQVPGLVTVADRQLPAPVLASAGALEIAVHGWDVARACGAEAPLPPALAEELLDLAPLLVTDEDRPRRFADVIPVSPGASASDRLLAYLGRSG